MCAKSLQSQPTLSDPMNCSPPVSPVCEDSLGKNTGVGCLVFLQGISLTQGSNPCLLCLLYWQASSLPLVPPRDLLISKSETHCQDRCQGAYCLCFLLRVLWFQVLHVCLQFILSVFFCTRRQVVYPTLFFKETILSPLGSDFTTVQNFTLKNRAVESWDETHLGTRVYGSPLHHRYPHLLHHCCRDFCVEFSSHHLAYNPKAAVLCALTPFLLRATGQQFLATEASPCAKPHWLKHPAGAGHWKPE